MVVFPFISICVSIWGVVSGDHGVFYLGLVLFASVFLVDAWGCRASRRRPRPSTIYRPVRELVRRLRSSSEFAGLNARERKARLASALLLLGMADAAGWRAGLSEEERHDLCGWLLPDLGCDGPLASRLLRFHRSRRVHHPAFSAITGGHRVHDAVCVSDEDGVVQAEAELAGLVADPAFPDDDSHL